MQSPRTSTSWPTTACGCLCDGEPVPKLHMRSLFSTACAAQLRVLLTHLPFVRQRGPDETERSPRKAPDPDTFATLVGERSHDVAPTAVAGVVQAMSSTPASIYAALSPSHYWLVGLDPLRSALRLITSPIASPIASFMPAAFRGARDLERRLPAGITGCRHSQGAAEAVETHRTCCEAPSPPLDAGGEEAK